MKRIVLLVVAVLLSIGLIATLNGSEYIGLTGLLNQLSTVDFSFSETTNVAISAFESFESIGEVEGFFDVLEQAVKGLFDLVRVPFIAIQEFVLLLRNILDLLFTLVGVF